MRLPKSKRRVSGYSYIHSRNEWSAVVIGRQSWFRVWTREIRGSHRLLLLVRYEIQGSVEERHKRGYIKTATQRGAYEVLHCPPALVLQVLASVH